MYDNAESMAQATPRDANGVPVMATPGLSAAPGVLKRLGDYWAALTAEDNGVTLQGVNPFTSGSRMGMEVKNDRLELGATVVTAPIFGLESAGQATVREVLAEGGPAARGPWFSSSMTLSERQAELAAVDTWTAAPEGAWRFDFATDSAQRITLRGVPDTTAANIKAVQDAGIPDYLSPKQDRHINPTDGRSPLTADPQQLLEGLHAGDYQIIRQPRPNSVTVDFQNSIGEYWQSRQYVGETQYGTVHFGKSGAHIVPANPNQW